MSAYNKVNQFIDTSKQIGAFSAYVRRPLPQISGLIAQFFGPNGDDSDSILALSLTKYLDAEVLITVYLIKNENGVIMKEANGTYPKISQFFGVIRRSKPTRGGMLAEFFATNGVNSDQVNELGKSIYQDCLVYIDVKGKLSKQEDVKDPTQVIDDEYANRVSQYQINEYKKDEKRFVKLNKQLFFDFLKSTNVLNKLGSNNDYIAWLNTKGCCWPNHCSNQNLSTYKVMNGNSYFNYLVFCDEHLKEIEEDIRNIPNQETYIKMKNSLSMQNWAFEVLRTKFSLTGKEEPDSKKIAIWAIENGLENFLPEDFKKLV